MEKKYKLPNGMLVIIRDISPVATNKAFDLTNEIEKAFDLLIKHEITEYFIIDKDGKLIRI